MLESKSRTGTRQTEETIIENYVCLLFVLSQCDFCSPPWRFCTKWMASCKGPITSELRLYSHYSGQLLRRRENRASVYTLERWFWRDFCNGAKLRLRRSLKWRVRCRIGVQSINIKLYLFNALEELEECGDKKNAILLNLGISFCEKITQCTMSSVGYYLDANSEMIG